MSLCQIITTTDTVKIIVFNTSQFITETPKYCLLHMVSSKIHVFIENEPDSSYLFYRSSEGVSISFNDAEQIKYRAFNKYLMT